MFTIHREVIDWAGRQLVLETGKIARQADGAVLATYGETTVLATVVSAKTPKPGVDFFPLTVNYQEKTFAAGRIPGGFFKREGRPSEKETLVSRLIDRPIRPLFPDGYRHDTQVVVTVLSHDLENDPDILAMVATSAALTISGIPFMGPVGAARVGMINGALKLNPTIDEMKTSSLDLVMAGTGDAVLMVESEAKELSEDVMLAAVMTGHRGFQPVLDAIIRLAEKAAKEPRDLVTVDKSAAAKAVADIAEHALRAAYTHTAKQERYKAIDAVKAKVTAALLPVTGATLSKEHVNEAFHDLQSKVVRFNILDHGIRIDGRDVRTVRPIIGEVGILPRAHGSALFTRGETQALVVATLGTGEDEQMIDSLEGSYKERFMLHYNFPPYSVGETGRMGSPGRREIGHGKLAWRALRPMLPTAAEFPYTIRLVSEITESNGSSSMATVCGTSLALMDAGVPLARPVAGIAMGLIKEDKGFAVLSDILGDEDHLGDMDFKVAGTEVGITSLQMDIKITSITPAIMEVALGQAKDGRLHILGEMAKGLSGNRTEVAATAPRITIITVPKEKIREVIGTGGKVIREIVEQTGCKIDINDDGTIKIASNDSVKAQAAIDKIRGIVAEPEIGVIYNGKVVKTAEFGAFVNFLGSKDGLVHISELAQGRVAKTNDVVNDGDMVKVKVIGFDDRGKVKLSMRVVDQESGEDISDKVGPKGGDREGGERSDRGDRNDRGDRGGRRDRGDRQPREGGETA